MAVRRVVTPPRHRRRAQLADPGSLQPLAARHSRRQTARRRTSQETGAAVTAPWRRSRISATSEGGGPRGTCPRCCRPRAPHLQAPPARTDRGSSSRNAV
jgi:hypothetical protein